MAVWIAMVVLTIGSPIVAPPASAAEDLLVDLKTLPGDDYSTALAINETGAVVGWSGLDFGVERKRAFLWEGGTMKDLGSLGGTQGTWAEDINDAGQVVGSSHNATNYERPFLWEAGNMTELDVRALEGGAEAINDAGQIVGWRLMRTDNPNDPVAYRAFLWQDGTVVDLGNLTGFRDSYATGINDAGQVVGLAMDPQNGRVRAFLWEAGEMKDLGTLVGDSRSEASDINDAGQVVGWSGGFGTSRAFLWEANVRMRPLGGSTTNAHAINGVGQVVGINRTAVVWHDGKETDLGSLVPGLPSVARDVNDAGAAVGQSDVGSGVAHAVLWVQVVPVHDVAVSAGAVNQYPTVGEVVPVDVMAKNLGNRPETFDVEASVGPYVLGNATVSLAPASSTTVRFEWNTTGVPTGPYSLLATATAVPGEVNLDDNVFRNERVIIVSLRLEALPSASVNETDVGVLIQFTCSKTDRRAPYGPYRYLWAFGDGDQATGERVSYAYASPGTKTATCSVAEEDGDIATAPITVRVHPRPSVQLRADRMAVSPGTPIRFWATAAGGSGRYTFSWDLGDGASATGDNVTYAYATPDNYTVVVSVVDTFGGVAPNATVTIAVSYILTTTLISPDEPVTRQSVTFQATSEGGAGSPYRYVWSFGDGASLEGETVTHAYERPGTYLPKLTVTDAAGASREVGLPAVTIRAAPPAAGSTGLSLEMDSTKVILGILVVAAVAGAILSVRRRQGPDL